MTTGNSQTGGTKIPSSAGFKSSANLSTNTILLSRKKMGMGNLPRQGTENTNFNSGQNVPPPSQQAPQEQPTATPASEMPLAKRMTATSVWCPKCDCSFEINPELYGVYAECSECGMEFQIPETPTESTSKIQIQAPPRVNRPGSRRPASKKKKGKSSQVYIYVSIIAVLLILLIYALTR